MSFGSSVFSPKAKFEGLPDPSSLGWKVQIIHDFNTLQRMRPVNEDFFFSNST